MNLDWDKITTGRDFCHITADPSQNAVTIDDGERRIRICASAESLDYCVRVWERILNSEGLICLDLSRWDGWRMCCRRSIRIPAERLQKLPDQGIGSEWGRAQGILLHVALLPQARLLELEEVCRQFQQAASEDAEILFSAGFSAENFLGADALGFERV